MNAPCEFAEDTGQPRVVDPLARAKKILVIDDELAICKFIESSLQSEGFHHLIFCHNGGQIASVVANERPHLIILDVMMPCGNGLRALRTLRANLATRNIPVIVISGYDPQVIGDSARDLADAFLTKPLLMPAMISHVSRLLAA